MDFATVGNKYREFFGVSPKPSTLLTFLEKRVILDIFVLDDFLHSKYGDYENQGYTMHELLQEKYGTECVEFVEKYCLLNK